MKSLLLQLYNGEISPVEQYSPQMKEYKKLRQEHYQHYKEFIKQLENLSPSLDKNLLKLWMSNSIFFHMTLRQCSLTDSVWEHE